MRPGMDQIPGNLYGILCFRQWRDLSGKRKQRGNWYPDTSLLYMGELKHHPILLCDGEAQNNRRPVYSWIMNNTWETNFKMDLSGFDEFCYFIELTDCKDAQASAKEIDAATYGIVTFISK